MDSTVKCKNVSFWGDNMAACKGINSGARNTVGVIGLLILKGLSVIELRKEVVPTYRPQVPRYLHELVRPHHVTVTCGASAL